jgi:sialate O-acetylesterase
MFKTLSLAIPMALAALALFSTPSAADIRLPGLVSDGMVLQRGIPAKVQGWADDGEKVAVTVRGQSASAVAADGKWSVTLKPMKAGGPFTMTIAGKNTVEVKNVLVGDVWVCSGQSNMEWRLSQLDSAKEDIANSANPMIHVLRAPMVSPDRPADNIDAKWQACDPDSVADFTAIGYYFGRTLQKDMNVPIGLIDASWGGTIIEWWTRASYYRTNPNFAKVIAARSVNGRVANGAVAYGRIGGIYNGLIAPLTWYPIKGVIWYQGESNCRRVDHYAELFSAMIRNWREDWGIGDFPFLAVQIAPFAALEYPADSWPQLREAQLLTSLNEPKVGLTVITDLGDKDNIHPQRKIPVAERLALQAKAIAYGQKIEYSGPIYKSMKISGSNIILRFSHVGKGLMAKSGEPRGFEIAGADGKFVAANAVIEANTVEVSSESVQKPTAARFGWAAYPVCDLWNKNGLPASPFRTNIPTDK